MKKSTAILIIIIYVASIILVGFFGMSVKVYDEIKYVKKIEISVEAESEKTYNFEYYGIDTKTENPKYILTVNFEDFATRDENDKLFVLLNLIPKVTYDTGDIAGSDAESIVYTLSSSGKNYVDKGYLTLNDYGTLVCYKSMIGFQIYVNPATKGGNGTGAIVQVYVV